MNINVKGIGAFCTAFLLICAPVQAHHSFAAEYDSAKPIRLQGKVTKLELVNPHAWLYVDVEDGGGKVVNWAGELSSPNNLLRNGWRPTSAKPGDMVTLEGFAAKDGTTTINVRSVTTGDGHRLFAGPASDPNPPRD